MASSKTSEYYNTTCHVVDPDTVIVQGMRFVRERTCKMVPDTTTCTCSNCGEEFGMYDGYNPYEKTFSHEYCPECRSRVVE